MKLKKGKNNLVGNGRYRVVPDKKKFTKEQIKKLKEGGY